MNELFSIKKKTLRCTIISHKLILSWILERIFMEKNNPEFSSLKSQAIKLYKIEKAIFFYLQHDWQMKRWATLKEIASLN